MKLFVDAMGTPANSGGMNLYAQEMVSAWAETFPTDQLVVLAGTWAADRFSGYRNVEVVTVRGTGVATRFWSQSVRTGWAARRRRCDVLLSLSPMVSPLFPKRRRVAVVHDWRHVRRPDEFGRAQRAYRMMWKASVRSAGLIVAISEKTRAETEEFARPWRIVVVPNGNDHPRRWERYEASPALEKRLVTYGHFVNKRPEPVIEATADLRARGVPATLVVLGARGHYRSLLEELVAAEGVDSCVDLPGYVDESEYQRILQLADVVILNSSDEGYGLPVSEAAYFGIPTIAASDSGLDAIHGDLVVLSSPERTSLADTIATVLESDIKANAVRWSWSDAAAKIRAEIGEA